MEDIELPKGSEPLKNKQHELFCHEYLIDLNITKAAIRAKFSEKWARQHGWIVFSRPEVQERIDFLKSERSKQLKIEQIDVLSRLWAIGTADPRELVKHKLVNCRFCWGEDHQYQWCDEAEFENALQRTIAEEKEIQKEDPDYRANYHVVQNVYCSYSHTFEFSHLRFERNTQAVRYWLRYNQWLEPLYRKFGKTKLLLDLKSLNPMKYKQVN